MPRARSQWSDATRLGGLRRFAFAITAFNLVGHTVLGFEQSWAQPVVAVLAAYCVELLLESIRAHTQCERPRYALPFPGLVDFLLSAHITGLAVAMLLYANDRLMPIVLASSVAVASKTIFRVNINGSSRHFLNPSNFGIVVVLLLFPWVGIAPPYHFTENLVGAGDWILPLAIILSGTFLNARFTRRLPLILAWLMCFVLQAGLRSLVFGAPLMASLMPMTGIAFVLFTFYMVTDPATTPSTVRRQIAFGASVALVYGLLILSHVVFGLFFGLAIVCTGRGMLLYAESLVSARRTASIPVTSGAALGAS